MRFASAKTIEKDFPMLLYVDKKKERQKKIKRILFITSIILIILINFIQFPIDLHQTQKQLINYKSKATPPEWYAQTAPITVLTTPQKKEIIFLIPNLSSRENLITLAKAFSLIPNTATAINISPEIPDSEKILKLAQIFSPQIKQDNKSTQFIVLSDEDKLSKLTETKNFVPYAIHHTSKKDFIITPEIQTFLDSFAPLPPTPQNTLEQEQENLKKLIKDNKDIILNSIPFTQYAKVDYPISAQYILLKNASVCISYANKKACTLNTNKSLSHNINETLHKLSQQEKAEQLSLLTSIQEIPYQTNISSNEGLLFRFEQREYISLPQEIEKYKKETKKEENIYRYIKQQAGINPDYHNPKMKFYKFKTVEINLNDNI